MGNTIIITILFAVSIFITACAGGGAALNRDYDRPSDDNRGYISPHRF